MENQMTNLRCRKCGAIVSADQKKCNKCGAPILLKVMMEEEKRHLSAKEIREKDKRMRQEYDKMNKEKEERRKKDEKKQQKLDEKKARAQEKSKAELDAMKAKEDQKNTKAAAKQAKAEAKAQKKADAPEKTDKKGKFPVWAIVLIILAVLAAGAFAYYFTRPASDEDYAEPEITEEVVEEIAEEMEKEQVEEIAEPVEEIAEQTSEEPSAEPVPEKKPERNITRNNYLFPSDTQYLTESDLNGLSKYDTGLIRNEIFARKGYVFKSEPYKSYFNSQAWYVPNSSAKIRLNAIEQYNKDFILEYERSQGWR